MADCTFDCGEGEITFPSFMGCALVNGFKNIQPRRIWGMNSKSVINTRALIIAKYNAKTATDMQLFYYWWATDLRHGHDPFIMTTYFMGHYIDINVRIKNKLEALAKNTEVWEFELELEVLDDLSSELLNGLEKAICAISEGC